MIQNQGEVLFSEGGGRDVMIQCFAFIYIKMKYLKTLIYMTKK